MFYLFFPHLQSAHDIGSATLREKEPQGTYTEQYMSHRHTVSYVYNMQKYF